MEVLIRNFAPGSDRRSSRHRHVLLADAPGREGPLVANSARQ
jgi:hypothetical protein